MFTKARKTKPTRKYQHFLETLETRTLLSGGGAAPFLPKIAPPPSFSLATHAPPALAPVINANIVNTEPAPDGYNAHDWEKYAAAVENNGLDDRHVAWDEIDGEMRLIGVWPNYSGQRLWGDLDLSGCTALIEVACSDGELTSLDISGCTALTWVGINNNQLTSLNAANCTALEIFYCESNQLTSLNVSGCTTMEELACSDNLLASLDASDCTNLKILSCCGNRLTSLNVAGLTKLERLYCWNNRLAALDVSGCGSLALEEGFYLDCSNNRLTALNVSGCTTLRNLDCSNNRFTVLDLSGCIELGELYYDYDRVASLNVSGCTSLVYLECYGATSLNVTGCTALRYLECYDGQLTSLDLAGCTALEELYCYNNRLTSLDLSGCPALEELNCNYNPLTSLNLTGCTALRSLDCCSTPFTFSTLPSTDVAGSYCYDYQYPVPIAASFAQGAMFDLSSEYDINGTFTTYTWYYADGSEISPDNYTEIDGTFVFHDLDENDGIYCEMTNDEFPDLTLRTTLASSKGYNANDWEKFAASDLIQDDVMWTIIDGEIRIESITRWRYVGELDLSDCTALTYLRCEDGRMTALNLAGCTALEYLNCPNNLLTALNVTGCTALEEVICFSNALTFSTLPPTSVAGEYDYYDKRYYNGQRNVVIADSLASNATLDLSSEHNIDGTPTTYTWYHTYGEEVSPDDYTEIDGTFLFHNLDVGDVLYCEMHNAKFPELMLTTTQVTITAATTPLDTPTGVTATSKNATTITVSWTAVENASGYVIQYTYNYIGDGDFSGSDLPLPTQIIISGTTTTVDITDLTSGRMYHFQVMATGTGNYTDSDYSTTASATPTPATTQLTAPTGVTAISRTASMITVNWTAVTNATGYVIEYATNSAFTGAQTKTIASGTTQTSDITGLAAGTTYYFRITATGTGSYTDSDYSSTASAATSITPVGPAADPVKAAGVKSTASLSTATLTWTANARNAQYVITCTSHSGIAPQTVTGNSVTIEGLQPGTSYKFEIVAKNADGKAAATVKASVKTQKYTAIKMGKAISTLGSVTLNWTASTMTETTGYKVYRVDSKTKVETLIWEGTTTTATINNLAPGTKYNFVVRAVAADLGIQSANAKASAATTKYAAVKKGKSANTPNSITLNWTASSFAETTGYEVYRVDPKTKAETLVWQGTATTATIDELLAGTKYTFIVRAVSSTLSIQSLATKISASTAK